MSDLTSGERRWIVWVAGLAVGLANLPMLLGFIAAPDGTVYTGIDSTAPGDVNVYLSYLRQVEDGHLAYRDLYTAEPQGDTIVNGFWMGLGLFGALLHLPPLATYLLTRIVLGFFLILLIYRFAAWFFSAVPVRRVATLLAVFAAGIGAWVAPLIEWWFRGSVPGPAWPMDLWVSEAFTFLSLHHSPHFLAATIMILGTVVLFIRTIERRSTIDAVWAGLIMFGLYTFHPFHALSLLAVSATMVATALWRNRATVMSSIGRLALAWVIATPALAYQAWLSFRDPIGVARAEQNILLTTWPGITLVSYGLLFVTAVIGAVAILRDRPSLRLRLLVAWAVGHGLAIYLPVFFNRRVTQGLNIALAMLAAPVVAQAVERLRRSSKRSTGTVFVLIVGGFLFTMSMLWVWAQDLSFLLGAPNRGKPPYYFYLSDDYRQAFEWIRQSTTEDDVVLSAAITGNFVPGWSGRTVVIGHNVETIRFDDKVELAQQFFDTETSAAERRRILDDSRATAVVIGPWEKRIGSFSGRDPSLKPAFLRGEVAVYRVVPRTNDPNEISDPSGR